MKQEPNWIAWPDDAPPRFNGGIQCDAMVGPCACGATHEDERLRFNVTVIDEPGSDD